MLYEAVEGDRTVDDTWRMEEDFSSERISTIPYSCLVVLQSLPFVV